MSTAKIASAAVLGLEGRVVLVEVDISAGLPKVVVVGLPDTAVQESRERVRAAIKNAGFVFPLTRVTINLAPADIRKEGPMYDLPIAIGILAAQGFFSLPSSRALFVGELSLEGNLRHVQGMLSIAALAKKAGFLEIFLPSADAAEASLIEGITIFPVDHIKEVCEHIRGSSLLASYERDAAVLSVGVPDPLDRGLDFVRGQEAGKRALVIAAAGGHNVLFSGPPGAGKTLLARSIRSVLPPLSHQEALEVMTLYSVAGELPVGEPLVAVRPFRHPHHTASAVSLVGGGQVPKPGEISLAHRGVLFLDEFPEYHRSVVEALRQPLEDGVITVARAAFTYTFPAKFILIASQNPCPCGYAGDETQQCSCTPTQLVHYRKKISGPIMDRIDLHLTLSAVKFDTMIQPVKENTTEALREKVKRAREIQLARFQCTGVGYAQTLPMVTNSEMSPHEIEKFCVVDHDSLALLRTAMTKMNLSNRAYHRILKVARTIADLEETSNIESHHIAEALQYRER